MSSAPVYGLEWYFLGGAAAEDSSPAKKSKAIKKTIGRR
jgi:hypothetical protein